MLEDACLPLLVLVRWWMHSWGPLLMAGTGKDRRMQDVRDPDLGPFPPFSPKATVVGRFKNRTRG